MYYYIFDIKKCKKRSQVQNLKDFLGGLGISGEFTYPTAAQTVEELVDLGLSKQYSTIVAIGGDEIANIVAGKLVGRSEAMGFIPLDSSPELAELIGATNWKEAAESLRYRKISEIYLGRTGTNNFFITSASLDIHQPVEITLEFKDFITQAKVKEFSIHNFNKKIKKIGEEFLDVTFTTTEQKGGLFNKLSHAFGIDKVETTEKNFSLIRARSLRIFTKNQINLLSGGAQIAKTPQLIESTDDKLRLITAKKTSAFWS